jgi:trk system potassium uptake protein
VNWRGIAKIVGQVVLGFGVTFALPMIWAIGYGEWSSLRAFLATTALTTSVGGGLYAWGRRAGQVHRRDALVLVALSWLLIPMFGALPFLFDGVFTSPVDAWFESVSGFTTTGATVLTEIEDAMSRSVHFWRMQTHWLGGMGIMVLFVAVLPSIGVGGKMLFKNEVPGPITEGLRPRIRETSLALWKIYIVLTLVQTLLLMAFGGMDLWNASSHAMSTLGTGGFSTNNASIAGFDSVAVDVICTVFMLIAGVNFSLYFMVVQGKGSSVVRDRELLAYAAIIVVATAAVTLSILGRHGGDLLQALRYGAFQVAAVATTTGFGTDDFDQYPPLARTLLFFLMFVGGCAGSTAGGLKVFRCVVMSKAAWMQIARTFRPQEVGPLKLRGVPIEDDVVRGIFAFAAAFFGLFVVGSLVMSLMSPDLETALSATIACLASIGPGLAAVGPTQNYGFFAAPAKVVLTLLMLFGRLEVYTLLVIFAPRFWRR